MLGPVGAGSPGAGAGAGTGSGSAAGGVSAAGPPVSGSGAGVGAGVAALGGNMRGEDVLWVDYETATSMHRVLTTNPKERRLERLASPTPLDNRISYGCINIPAKFYENVVRPAFTGTYGIVYVLPETKPAREVFASYDVDERERQQAASPAATMKVSHSN